jgi:hypothetical protein
VKRTFLKRQRAEKNRRSLSEGLGGWALGLARVGAYEVGVSFHNMGSTGELNDEPSPLPGTSDPAGTEHQPG